MKWQRRWILGSVIGMTLFRMESAGGEVPLQKGPQITVVICDLAGIDHPTRKTAENELTRILTDAGVNIARVNGDGGKTCALPALSSYLLLVVLPEAPPGWVSSEAIGLAVVREGPIRRGYVFNNYVKTFVKSFVETSAPDNRRKQAHGVMLGHAMAHELAHLLIPGESHTREGIMRPQWSYRHWEEAAAGRLGFSEYQAGQIRRTLEEQGKSGL